jgi:hypothetical protein
MYSYEDRIRAVELYIKLGKRVRPTIRQLGYPTRCSVGSLKSCKLPSNESSRFARHLRIATETCLNYMQTS